MSYFIVFILLVTGSCKQTPYKTPAEFMYIDTTGKQTYQAYESKLTDSIKSFIKHKQGPYHPKEYDEQTL